MPLARCNAPWGLAGGQQHMNKGSTRPEGWLNKQCMQPTASGQPLAHCECRGGGTQQCILSDG